MYLLMSSKCKVGHAEKTHDPSLTFGVGAMSVMLHTGYVIDDAISNANLSTLSAQLHSMLNAF